MRALAALHRLRHLETDAARRDLAEALAGETRIEARDAAITQERDAARRMTGAYDQQTYAAWLARMRAEQEHLAAAQSDARARTAAARADLARRRMAETAAGEALAKARAAHAKEVAHRDQVMLEDIARALRS